MQLNRLSHLIFPKAPAAPTAEPSAHAGGGMGHTRHEAALAASSPGVLYTASPEVAAVQPSEDMANMSLEDLIALGKSKGVFNHITYTRNGSFGPGPGAVQEQPQADFVSSAVSIMRDFQEGMAALKTETQPAIASKPQLWENGFKSIRQAVGRLNVMA